MSVKSPRPPRPPRIERVTRIIALGLALAFAVGCHLRPLRTQRPPADSATDGDADKLKDHFGGVTTVNVDGSRPVARVEQLFEGLPGVQVQRTNDGGYSVRIHGAGSWMLNTEPLFVVDDMAIQEGHGRGLAWLNPHDVVRITVLKDAVDTAIYGIRGANGVIIIQTMRRR